MSNQPVTCISPERSSQGRLFYFDFIRAFACLSVVMLHSSMNFAVAEVGSTDFWFGNFFDSLARPGVPLFVMLSGALMLDENYAFTREKWIGHIVKLCMFFAFWSVSYCFVFQVMGPLIRHEAIDSFSTAWAILKGHYRPFILN